MTSYISADLRRLVESRAGGVCEYCLIHERDTYLGCQIDHVISEKHGGLTIAANLAFACTCCNRAKGSDIGSIALSTGSFVRLFNPRHDRWTEHFKLGGGVIEPLTPIGEVTTFVLALNEPNRLEERQILFRFGRYPPIEAQGRGHGIDH